MSALSLLRSLAEQQQFSVLRDACMAGDQSEPAERLMLALAQAHLGESAAAHAGLAALDEAALDLQARIDLAAVHLALGQLSRGSELLEAALPEAGEHGLLLARLAWCRMQQQRDAEALDLYRRSATAEPRIAVLLNLLRLHLQMGEWPQCQSSLDQARAAWAQQRGDWPETQQHYFDQQLRGLQLALWLATQRHAEAEAWLSDQRDGLNEEDWCGLLLGCAQRLAAQDRHAQAEELLRSGLQHYPQHLTLYEQLAELAHVQGRAQQAAALLRRAIQLAESLGRHTLVLWARLSAVSLLLDERAARHAAERALALAESAADDHRHPVAFKAQWRTQAELAVAGVDAQALRYDEARRRYQALIDGQPDCVPALLGLGHLQMQLGRIEEALALFEQVKRLDPARGHAALINARRFPDDDAALAQLERLARTPGPEGRVSAGLLFQLAAAWEKRRDYTRAFALVDEANASRRKLLSYDPRAHRQRCARLRHAFSPSLYEHRRDLGVDASLPVFVLGMPRSGTTLVEQILAGHSQIHGAGELGLIPQLIAGLERWERRTGSGRHYPDCVDDLSADAVAGITGQALKELQDYAPEARHVIDKLPHNFENIGLIKLLFPKARIISVRRDPRDIAISNYFTDYAAKHGGMGFAYDLGWIGEQLADHNLLMHHWQQLFPGGILEVNYEDVVADAEGQARRMLDYIGVQWEPQVLNFNELERPVKTASVWQVRQPIYATSKARWERYREHLAPLIRGSNAKIEWQPITDMVTLPEPGLLDSGVALYREERLDEAEYRFQQLLHHLPEHAAANFMVGLIYVRKGHLPDGIALMEKALQRCPWNKHWRSDLAQACRMAGRPEQAAALQPGASPTPMDSPDPAVDAPLTEAPAW